MLQDIVKRGTTSWTGARLFCFDSSTFLPKTDVVYSSSGIDLWYQRQGGSRTAITEATLAADNSAYSSGGFKHVSDGYYRLDLPDAALASSAGVNFVDFGGTVTGGVFVGGRIKLTDLDMNDAVRAGLTALPNANAEASGGLYTRGTGAGQINQDANGRVDTNVAAISADTTAADNCELMFDGTGYAGGTTRLNVNAAALGGTVQTGRDVGASVLLSPGTGTGQISLSSGAVTVGTNNDKTGYTASTVSDKTGYSLSSAGIQAIWDALTSALTTVGSIGKRLVDYITGDTYTRIGAPAGASIAADIAAIEAQTDDIGAAGAGLTAVPWNAAWDAEVQSECQDAITASALASAAELAKVPKSDGTSTWNATALASINSEIVDALNTDTYAEPGQGNPPATTSLVQKIGYLYKNWRNKKTQTSSEWALYADDTTTKDQEAAVSDDGTTTTKGEIGTGA